MSAQMGHVEGVAGTSVLAKFAKCLAHWHPPPYRLWKGRLDATGGLEGPLIAPNRKASQLRLRFEIAGQLGSR